MDPKETLGRIAPQILEAIEAGDVGSLAWGMVPHTSGRVFVRKFSVEFGGWGMVEVRLDRVPVWRSISASSGDWEWDPHWVPTDSALEQRKAERITTRARQARRDADRLAVLEAIRKGRPVRHWAGEHGYGGVLMVGEAVASARGVYRTLTGNELPLTAGGLRTPAWRAWLAEVTNPRAFAPVRRGSRARRDAVEHALAAEGM